jgi:hypothetical protein
VRNLLHRQDAAAEFPGTPWCRLGRAPLPAAIDAPLLRHGDPRRLPLPPVLRLDPCQSEQHARHHPAHRPAQVDLLGHGYYPDPAFTPIRGMATIRDELGHWDVEACQHSVSREPVPVPQ